MPAGLELVEIFWGGIRLNIDKKEKFVKDVIFVLNAISYRTWMMIADVMAGLIVLFTLNK